MFIDHVQFESCLVRYFVIGSQVLGWHSIRNDVSIFSVQVLGVLDWFEFMEFHECQLFLRPGYFGVVSIHMVHSFIRLVQLLVLLLFI